MSKFSKILLLGVAFVILTVGSAEGLIRARNIEDFTTELNLPLTSFVATDDAGTGFEVISSTTVPGIEMDNSRPAVVWADGETNKIKEQ